MAERTPEELREVLARVYATEVRCSNQLHGSALPDQEEITSQLDRLTGARMALEFALGQRPDLSAIGVSTEVKENIYG